LRVTSFSVGLVVVLSQTSLGGRLIASVLWWWSFPLSIVVKTTEIMMSYEDRVRGMPIPTTNQSTPPQNLSSSTVSPITEIMSVCRNSDELRRAIARHSYPPPTPNDPNERYIPSQK
jgi:hypothetical protein